MHRYSKACVYYNNYMTYYRCDISYDEDVYVYYVCVRAHFLKENATTGQGRMQEKNLAGGR